MQQAIKETSLLTEESMEAVKENKFLKQCELLMYSRAGTKTEIQIEFENGKKKTIQLISYNIEDLEDAVYYPERRNWKKLFKSPVFDKYYSNYGIGYIRINIFMPNLLHYNIPGNFKRKLKKLIKKNIHSLIIDLRGNMGGIDKWAAQIAGHFVNEPMHYQYISKYNPLVNRFEIDTSKTLIVQTKETYFDGNILILVDNHTASTAEGIPNVLMKLPNVTIAGQYSTSGVFASGFSDFIFKMPKNIIFGFLEGRSLDKEGNIQIDSDFSGEGGIKPDLKIPVSYNSINFQFVEKKDFALDYSLLYLTNLR
jgi:carboxyl-terminal processing protease